MAHHQRLLPGLLTLALLGCGGGGGGGSTTTPPPPANVAPTADAGGDQAVDEQTQVSLDGGGSSDSDGTVQSYAWSQTAGANVTLSGGDTQSPSFQAPSVSAADTLTFQLTVTDDDGATDQDTVDITVNPVAGMNDAPVANAGADRTVAQNSAVTLDGSGSTDGDGSIQVFAWTQTAGPSVTLNDAMTAMPSFTAPAVANPTDLTFELTVTDNEGATATDPVTIEVVDAVAVTGRVTFDQIGFAPGGGLDYGNVVEAPVRAATVQLIDASDRTTVVGTATTDANGDFSIQASSFPPMAFVRARAEMIRAGAPSWDFTVRDNTQSNALYVLDGAEFNPAASPVANLRAGLGWGGSSYSGPRAAAPFSILDAAYQAMQLVLSADPVVQFAPLRLHWSPQNMPSSTLDRANGLIGTTSFFAAGSDPGIYVLGLENNDTDEFDQHVLAHEWGHYFESAFSRTDTVAGPHSLSDQLDFRLAFGEGFGNAFAAMVRGDSVYRDSFGTQQGQDFGFDVEGRIGTNAGWYNEESVQELLYDFFDADIDGADTVALGFGPLYDVLVDEQRQTSSLTSIFSFVDALKAENSGEAAVIDTLLGDQSIDPIVDAYGSNESNAGNPPSGDVLPVFESLTVGGAAVNLCSDDVFGSGNRLGVRVFARFSAQVSASHVITATRTDLPPGASASDPELRLFDRGLVQTATTIAADTETLSRNLTAGTEYVIEVYEFTNTTTNPIGRTCFDVTVVQQ